MTPAPPQFRRTEISANKAMPPWASGRRSPDTVLVGSTVGEHGMNLREKLIAGKEAFRDANPSAENQLLD